MTKKIVIIAARQRYVHPGPGGRYDFVARFWGPWELGLVDIDPLALETAEASAGGWWRLVGWHRHQRLHRPSRTSCPLRHRDQRDWCGRPARLGNGRVYPRKYGIYQPVGDSVMSGGVSRAMRMIPALVDIAHDVKSLCRRPCLSTTPTR